MNTVNREILLSFWKVHILHHANEEPIHGQWILTELRRHGYEISPGTLYPLLNAMEQRGYLKSRKQRGGRTARKLYRATPLGRKGLALAKTRLKEFTGEAMKD